MAYNLPKYRWDVSRRAQEKAKTVLVEFGSLILSLLPMILYFVKRCTSNKLESNLPLGGLWLEV